MPRGLDHVVHAVRDLNAAGGFYRWLGFTVGARNRHPCGTHNRLDQLPGFFVELLTCAEPEKLSGGGFSLLFGEFTRNFLLRQEGLEILLLENDDATRDAADFRSANIALSDALASNARAGDRTVPRSRSRSRLPSHRSQARPIQPSPSASSIIRRISGIRRSRSTPMAQRRSRASCWSLRTLAIITFFSRPSSASARCWRHRPASRSRRRAARCSA